MQPQPDIKILYRFEMKVTVQLPIENEPTERLVVPVIAEDHDSAKKIGLYLARKRGKVQRYSKSPKLTEIALAYYPNRPGAPDCTAAELEELRRDFELPR